MEYLDYKFLRRGLQRFRLKDILEDCFDNVPAITVIVISIVVLNTPSMVRQLRQGIDRIIGRIQFRRRTIRILLHIPRRRRSEEQQRRQRSNRHDGQLVADRRGHGRTDVGLDTLEALFELLGGGGGARSDARGCGGGGRRRLW